MFTTCSAEVKSEDSETSKNTRRLDIENEKLRSRLALMEAENKMLLRRISELTKRLASETHQDAQLALALELKLLQERINAQNREIFGKKSEKRGRPASAKPKTPEPPKRKRTGSQRTAQPKLPTATQLHLLDEADQICPKCGGKLHAKAGRYDSSERILVTERIYTLVTDQKQVYGCGGCGASETALAPTQLVPGGRYDTSIAINAAVAKYADHQPLNRQVRAMARLGLNMSRQALWNQLDALARVCEPSYRALHEWMLTSHKLLHADETT